MCERCERCERCCSETSGGVSIWVLQPTCQQDQQKTEQQATGGQAGRPAGTKHRRDGQAGSQELRAEAFQMDAGHVGPPSVVELWWATSQTK